MKSLGRPFVPLLGAQIPGKVVSHALVTAAFKLQDQVALLSFQLYVRAGLVKFFSRALPALSGS